MRVLSGARLYVLWLISSHVSLARLAQHPAPKHQGLSSFSTEAPRPPPISRNAGAVPREEKTHERIRNRTIPQHHLRRHPRMARVVVSHEILIRHPSLLLNHDRAFYDFAETGCAGGGIASGEGGVELHFWGLGSVGRGVWEARGIGVLL